MLLLALTLLSMLFAVGPMLCFLLLIWWLDRYEREPFWLVGLVFAWGAVGGVAGGLIGGLLLGVPADMLLDPTTAEQVKTVLIAPLVEEPAKALVLLAVYFSRQFDNTTDGFVYGAAAGLGFGMTENFLYFMGAAAEGDLLAWMGIVVVRTLWSALMHAGATSMVGAALGYAKFRGWGAKLLVVPLAFCAALAMHALWNGLITLDQAVQSGGFTLLNLLLFPAEFFVLFVVLQVCLLDERATIRRELSEEAAAGVLPEAHLPTLSSYLKRGRRGWLQPGVDHHAYVHAATTLAFRKHQARARPGRFEAELGDLRMELRGLLRGRP